MGVPINPKRASIAIGDTPVLSEAGISSLLTPSAPLTASELLNRKVSSHMKSVSRNVNIFVVCEVNIHNRISVFTATEFVCVLAWVLFLVCVRLCILVCLIVCSYACTECVGLRRLQGLLTADIRSGETNDRRHNVRGCVRMRACVFVCAHIVCIP